MDTVAFNVAATAGPFIVTYPNTNIGIPALSTQTITWNVAGTDASPVSCSNRNILNYQPTADRPGLLQLLQVLLMMEVNQSSFLIIKQQLQELRLKQQITSFLISQIPTSA